MWVLNSLLLMVVWNFVVTLVNAPKLMYVVIILIYMEGINYISYPNFASLSNTTGQVSLFRDKLCSFKRNH